MFVGGRGGAAKQTWLLEWTTLRSRHNSALRTKAPEMVDTPEKTARRNVTLKFSRYYTFVRVTSRRPTTLLQRPGSWPDSSVASCVGEPLVLSPKRYCRGPRSQEVKEGETILVDFMFCFACIIIFQMRFRAHSASQWLLWYFRLVSLSSTMTKKKKVGRFAALLTAVF